MNGIKQNQQQQQQKQQQNKVMPYANWPRVLSFDLALK